MLAHSDTYIGTLRKVVGLSISLYEAHKRGAPGDTGTLFIWIDPPFVVCLRWCSLHDVRSAVPSSCWLNATVNGSSAEPPLNLSESLACVVVSGSVACEHDSIGDSELSLLPLSDNLLLSSLYSFEDTLSLAALVARMTFSPCLFPIRSLLVYVLQ